MAGIRHIWLAGGGAPLCPPINITYYDQSFATVTPSHGDYTDYNILTDQSDSTWIDFTSGIFAANPDFHDRVGISFDHVYEDSIVPPSTAELVIYYKADQDFRFQLFEGFGLTALVDAVAVIGETNTDPAPWEGWRKARLTFASGWNHTNIVDLFDRVEGPAASGGWVLEASPPLAADDTQSFTHPSRITEIRVGFATFTPGAPPCRLFPREDGLGVGSGRIFPPPKSQQRSGRRFGYY